MPGLRIERSSIPHQSEIPRCLQKQPRLCRLHGERSEIQKCCMSYVRQDCFHLRAKCDSLWKWIKTSLRMCHCTNSTDTHFNTKYFWGYMWLLIEHYQSTFFSPITDIRYVKTRRVVVWGSVVMWKQMSCYLITMQPMDCIKIEALSNSSPIIN